ncbi:Immunity protein 26 [Kosakonia sp. BK9b]
MNLVYFKVDNLPHEKTSHGSFSLKGVELLRDGEVVVSLGDVKVDTLPVYRFCTVPTGFRKIEYRIKSGAPARIHCSAGYLKTGEYLVDTPQGEQTFAFNALNGQWTLDKNAQVVIDVRAFVERKFTLVRPAQNINRNAPVY